MLIFNLLRTNKGKQHLQGRVGRPSIAWLSTRRGQWLSDENSRTVNGVGAAHG